MKPKLTHSHSPVNYQPLRLAWVYGGTLNSLDAATWLEPVQILRDLNWQVLLVAAGDPQEKSIQGVEIVHIARPNIYLWRQVIYHLRVYRLLARRLKQIDIILFHEASSPWFLLLFIFLRAIRKKNPLFVMDTRTLPMEPEDKSTWKAQLRAAFSMQMNKLGNQFFDGRTTITKRMAESLRVPPKKLWGTWHSGVNLETFARVSNNREFPLANEPIQITYIGSMDHERNLLTLAKAVTEANETAHRFSLTIIGDGNARSELEEYAQTDGVHIRIQPPVPHKEIPGYLAQAHIGVLPFPDEEKFRVSSPIKLFEYLAAGVPILATRIVCHTDVIANNHVVFWAETSDQKGLCRALMQISANRADLPAMSYNALDLAQHWSWQASTEKLKRALENGLKSRKSL